MKFTKIIEDNKALIQKVYEKSEEMVFKDFLIKDIKATIVYFKALTDTDKLSDFVLTPCSRVTELPKKDTIDYIKGNCILITEVLENDDVMAVSYELARGKSCVFIEGYEKALILATEKMHDRSIEEPPTSAVSRGPRSGFNENIRTNISTIRRLLATPYLHSTQLYVGTLTKTQVNIMYLSNVADDQIVSKIVDKIKLINIDGIIDTYYIAQFLEQRPKSMFKQTGFSEKPDIVAAKLLEGRIAVLVDGSPIVLTLPFVLIEDLQSPDDYYNQHYRVIILRIIRIISIFLTIILPALYISIMLYHYRALPINFLTTILNSTQGLPFTPFSEILVIIVLFEILYEASLRMPKYLGLALSVVGALILGDTAVKAGLMSPPAVMIIAVSGIAIYTIPEQAAQLSILRTLFVLAGGVLGFYGLMLMSIFLVIYLCDFDNYGAPYLSPISPQIGIDKKDAVFKADILSSKARPVAIPNKNTKRSR